MTCSKNAEIVGGGGHCEGGQSSAKTYGYIDLFKSIGDRLPLEIFTVTPAPMLIGRDPGCQIRIKNARISRKQCEILVIVDGHDFRVCLHNVTSRSTTVCHNQEVAPGEQVTLQHGVRFRLFDIEFRYRLYDPINEKGELDWSRPIPLAKLPQPKPEPTPPQNIPIIKVHKPEDSCPAPKFRDYRRQSFPLAHNVHPKMDLLKLPRGSPAWAGTPPEVRKNRKQTRETPQEVTNNNLNRRASSGVTLKSPTMIMGNSAYKRRGSNDFDMRKAVLQRSFRRAFKEKVINGIFTDVNDERYRRAVTDMVLLSSAA